MKKEVLPIVLILVVILAVGCATTRYKYNNKTFNTSEEALNEQAKVQSDRLTKITPTNDPVHGTLLMVLPSDAEIQKNYIKNASSGTQEQIQYLTASIKMTFQFFADATRKRGAFDSVSAAFQDGNPASYPIGEYDYLMFVDVDGWFLRIKGNPKPLKVGPQGNLNFEPIEELARNLRSK